MIDAATLSLLSPADKAELLALLEEQERRIRIRDARNDLLSFARAVYPGFKVGGHHRIIGNVFKDVVEGRERRVIINIAPRMGKSEFSSYLFPPWFLGRFPDRKVIMATHTAGLSEDFGRRIRNLLDDDAYQSIFPDTVVAPDQKSAGKWSTTANGQYYAVGVGGALAGRGADLLVIDDPVSEQAVMTNSTLAFETAWNWFQTGPLQRLMPGGAIVVIMTRWSLIDLTGRLIKYAENNPDSPPWKLIELPAVIDGKDSDGNAVQKSLWPEQWPLKELLEKKAGMDPRYWNAQYMQRPTAAEAQIVKRDWWRVWPHSKPPECKFILHSIDPAFEAKTSADYTAFTCWGVFEAENDRDDGRIVDNVILLDAWKARIEFPELKRSVIAKYKEWKPDTVLIEKKASGAPLIQELRLSGYPVSEFTPSRGKVGQSNDKTARLNAVSDLFSSGRVWVPDKRWAWEVVDEVASFPVGENDDYVDSTSQAMLRIRQGGLIALNDNALDTDEIDYADRPRKRRFYGMRG